MERPVMAGCGQPQICRESNDIQKISNIKIPMTHNGNGGSSNDNTKLKDEQRDDALVEIDIGYEVKVKVPNTFVGKLQDVEVVEVSVKDRNKIVKPNLLPAGITFASSIYKLKFCNACELKETTGVYSKENVNTLCSTNRPLVQFNVPLAFSCIDKANNKFAELSVISFNDDASMKTVPATYEEGYAYFITPLQIPRSFVLVLQQRKFYIRVCPERSLINIPETGIVLTFEPKCVPSDEQLTYTIESPSIHGNGSRSTKLVLAASSRICLSYDKSKFVKPITIEAKLNSDAVMKYKPTEEFPILLGFRNGQVIVDSNVRKLDEDVFSGQVKGYDGACICICRKFKQDNKSQRKQLEDEISLVYGKKIKCHLIIFSHKRNTKSVLLSVSCCNVQDAESVKLKNREKGGNLICQTEMVMLKQIQRLKIQISGCIEYAGQGSHLWLLFVSHEDRCEAYFKVNINRRLGKSPEGIVTFLTETNQRISSLEFNLDKIAFSDSNATVVSVFDYNKEDRKHETVAKEEKEDTKQQEYVSIEEEIQASQMSRTIIQYGSLVLTNPTIERFEQ